MQHFIYFAAGAVVTIALEFLAVMWMAHKKPLFDDKDRWYR